MLVDSTDSLSQINYPLIIVSYPGLGIEELRIDLINLRGKDPKSAVRRCSTFDDRSKNSRETFRSHGILTVFKVNDENGIPALSNM